MTENSLALRAARYYWLSNLAVMLGVAVGAAVLVGALVIGDSLRGSLRDRALHQLNGVDATYTGPRLIHQSIATDMSGQNVPVLMLQGSINAESDAQRRIAKVNILGINSQGAETFHVDETTDLVAISQRIADDLQVKVGDTITFNLPMFSNIPRSSVLGRRDNDRTIANFSMKVTQILPAHSPQADFSILPNPETPLNVYVSLSALQKQVEAESKVNTVFAMSDEHEAVNQAFAQQLTLDDWGLRVAANRKEYVTIESQQLTLPDSLVKRITTIATDNGLSVEPTTTYLANAIAEGKEPVLGDDVGKTRKLIPYSVIAGLDPEAKPPLGPFDGELADDEILLLNWDESPLKGLPIGSPITVTYFNPEQEAMNDERSHTFKLKGYVPFTGVADDPDLTPPFPGITDQLSIRSWDSPFEIVLGRIEDRDEKFWEDHKTTPKAYINPAIAAKIFSNRFGHVTSLRIAPKLGQSPAELATLLEKELLAKLDPKDVGLVFTPTREQLLTASKGGTDFAVLFLMFSVLLIGAALLLVGLLFRLTIERRANQLGLLLATGYTPGRVLRLLLIEGLLVAVVGTITGIVAALGYAELMLTLLKRLWPNGAIANTLFLHVQWWTPIIGFVCTVLVALATIWFSVRRMVRLPAPQLLRGRTTPPETELVVQRSSRWSLISAVALLLVGIAALYFGTTRSNPDERAMGFFGGGGMILAAGLLAARAYLRHLPEQSVPRTGSLGIAELGLNYARRNLGRSLLTATLIAIATFLVISVESFRRRPDINYLDKNGGSGGFALIAEAELPIYQPPTTDEDKGELYDRLQQDLFQPMERKNPTGPSRSEMEQNAEKVLEPTQFYPLLLNGGDDASCANLFRARQPRVVGVPPKLIDRGGFQFGDTVAETDAQSVNPWLLLDQENDDAIPIIVEQNTAMFMLRKMIGGTLTIRNENNEDVPVRIVALLQDSVFQSSLMMSEANFHKLFPHQEGYRLMLIDASPSNQAEVSDLLEAGYQDNGLSVRKSVDIVAGYQAVVGTYLTTFQLLGSLALLLAILGLAVVVLRSVWERVGELALLRAVGFRTRDLQILVLSETLLVLVIGLVIGLVAALLSVLPNLALGGSIPWLKLLLLLLAVAVTGTIVAWIATFSVARAPLVPALRRE